MRCFTWGFIYRDNIFQDMTWLYVHKLNLNAILRAGKRISDYFDIKLYFCNICFYVYPDVTRFLKKMNDMLFLDLQLHTLVNDIL